MRVIERKADDDYENALRTMQEIPYRKWREHDSADTMLFYALGLHEAGMIQDRREGRQTRPVPSLIARLRAPPAPA